MNKDKDSEKRKHTSLFGALVDVFGSAGGLIVSVLLLWGAIWLWMLVHNLLHTFCGLFWYGCPPPS